MCAQAILQSDKDTRTLVAMSGGVDSAAAAVLLHEQGHEVVGVSMQVWDYRQNGGSAGRATCCAPSDFDDARKIADRFRFPFYVFDFEQSFSANVIEPFIESYLRGETPNPCIDCNRYVKFAELRARASQLGFSRIATGHYARVRRGADGAWGLYTARDVSKDQSYFLAHIKREELPETIFPLGELTKPEVRALLRERGLEIAEKSESQDICFVGGTVGEFVAKHRASETHPGKFVSESGEELGEHDGIHQFTIGQRRGLGVSGKERLYVVGIDSENHQVKLGNKESAASDEFYLREVNWLIPNPLESTFKALVKVRYRSEGLPCEISQTECGIRVRLLGGKTPVSPGQGAVFYALELEEDGARQVLGGGTIHKSPDRESSAYEVGLCA